MPRASIYITVDLVYFQSIMPPNCASSRLYQQTSGYIVTVSTCQWDGHFVLYKVVLMFECIDALYLLCKWGQSMAVVVTPLYESEETLYAVVWLVLPM
jgi:hypothetical protein